VILDVPAHAHIDFSGTDWDCDRPYRKRGSECSPPPEAVDLSAVELSVSREARR